MLLDEAVKFYQIYIRKNPVIDDEDHPISAAWGRYTKVGDLDCKEVNRGVKE